MRCPPDCAGIEPCLHEGQPSQLRSTRWVRVVVVDSVLPPPLPMLPLPMLPLVPLDPMEPLAPLVPVSLPVVPLGLLPVVPPEEPPDPMVPVLPPEPVAPVVSPVPPEAPVLPLPVLPLPVLLPEPMVPVLLPEEEPEGDCSVVALPPEVLPPGEVELPWASAAPQVALTARVASRPRKRFDAFMSGTP